VVAFCVVTGLRLDRVAVAPYMASSLRDASLRRVGLGEYD
jgi:hypothetical protein